ncbi:MAG: DUF4345 family protein [Pseudomonadota bacterium]|nr:DUF4345 family protein [Pseudomonadota bacterium]MEC7831006.1 DUF4345 family protein [Pseudomonadota bacterium]MEC9414148.1 DUF4345 family protein [Pseudomonadota bacterium]|tara:strand:- start:196 stop:576 length:381 start_codon:yes stop_codon:yes gene_type:complete
MTLIINLLTYLVGIIWLAAGLSGVINPAIFTESDWASLHVQITGTLGMSDIRSLGGLFAAIGLGVLYASHNPSGKKGWFSAFAFLMLGLAIGRTVSLYLDGAEQTQIIFAAFEYGFALILFLKSRY